ncbi:hypothetical protein [Bergeyella sp. RCAD1439]|uniref:hypothetical protein n=1 Tax=Bergeyella anatis TaxID=3113737 RepID=UPI002E189182|nr:hypothetical protein [Bergeyella sp. RCAD1439]
MIKTFFKSSYFSIVIILMMLISSQFDYIFDGFNFFFREIAHICFNLFLIFLMVGYKDYVGVGKGGIRAKVGIYTGIVWFSLVTVWSCFNLLMELLI